ncbi:MAG: hypothetical protein HYZ94_02365 [Candidatus Omnitrophica bacterium]|nr:hypothetical protein [Candidatus Omnitrophota bacterium]
MTYLVPKDRQKPADERYLVRISDRIRAVRGSGQKQGERGIALATAIVAALLISVTALVVLGVSMRRFELSAARSDHARAMVSSEAGLQYAFARLAKDSAFENDIRTDADPPYVVSPLAVNAQVTVPYNGGTQTFIVDEQDTSLRTDRDVHVVIDVFPEVPPVVPVARLKVHAYSDFGT